MGALGLAGDHQGVDAVLGFFGRTMEQLRSATLAGREWELRVVVQASRPLSAMTAEGPDITLTNRAAG